LSGGSTLLRAASGRDRADVTAGNPTSATRREAIRASLSPPPSPVHPASPGTPTAAVTAVKRERPSRRR